MTIQQILVRPIAYKDAPLKHLTIEALEQKQLLAADISFEPLPALPTGRQPFDIVADDFDGDGDIDLVTANQCAQETRRCGGSGATYDVSVILNNADGTFSPEVRYDAVDTPQGVAAANFDADSNKDLVVTNSGADVVSILKGNGDGTFTSTAEFPAGSRPRSIVAGDFNGDNAADVIVTNMLADGRPSNKVTVLLGNNDGTFDSPTEFGAGREAAEITAGDIDNDGDLDVVTGNGTGSVSVMINTGNATFEEAIHYRTRTGVTLAVDLADVNGDSHPDIVASGSQVSVLLGTGDGEGTFASAIQYGTRNSRDFFAHVAMDTGDLDGDGDIDVAAIDFSSGTMTILANDGEGSFPDETQMNVGKWYWSMVIADFDADDDADIAAINNGDSNILVLVNSTEPEMEPLPGDANMDGVFDQLDIIEVLKAGKYNSGEPAERSEGDWNGDGLFDQLDIVFALQAGTYLQGQ